MNAQDSAGTAAAAVRSKEPAPGTGRVVSIDAIRGFDMFWLMGGRGLAIALAGVFSPAWSKAVAAATTHAEWQGFTFWDFIAPLFLFIVGLSMPFALARRLERSPRGEVYRHIFKRAVLLILLSWMVDGWLDLDPARFRFTGVLVRIALAYLIAAVIVVNTRVRGQILWAAGLVLAHWAVVALIPAPGFGAGNFTPQGNLAGYLDRLTPGRHCCYPYGDNMGFLGAIPAAGTVLLGALCGHLVRLRIPAMRKVLCLAAGGAASLALALLWSSALPIITKMWTGSYVLWANGWSMLLFALFYWIIDVRGWRGWAFPFVVIGMNSIFAYVLPTQVKLIDIANIFVRGVIAHAGPYKELVSAASVFAVAWLILYFMYRKKIFLSV